MSLRSSSLCLTSTLLLACAGDHTAQEPPRAPVTEQPVVLLRGAKPERYRIQVDSDEGRGPQTVTGTFELSRTESGVESVTLLDVARGPRGTELPPVAIDLECRRAFGGDERVVGRFDVDGTRIGTDLVPACIPEPVFGLVTDIISVLLVQSADFGAQRLRAAGDAHAFDAFSVTWQRPPTALDARIECSGGTLALESLWNDRAVLVWTPQPMHHAIVRAAATGQRLMLAGTETCVLAAEVDPRDGTLLAARSRADHLDMRLWMGFEGTTAPRRADVPKSGGMALAFDREIVVARVER
jgi:hypothetical protein